VTAVATRTSPRTDLFVGGEWRAPSDGARFDAIDPATADVIASVASATVEDAERTVGIAARALPEWASTSPRHRSDVLRRSYELLIQRSEE
jgi:succinate-semialdehyde dehydrogenase/glutarate-semialdehyde dehydrogenase